MVTSRRQLTGEEDNRVNGLSRTDAAGSSGSEDRLMRPEEVAKMLGISVRNVWRLRSDGYLPAVKIGRSTRFRLSHVEHLLRAGTH